MSTYSSIEEYTADVEAARDAYAADMAVQEGCCASCRWRKVSHRHRRCSTCRKVGR